MSNTTLRLLPLAALISVSLTAQAANFEPIPEVATSPADNPSSAAKVELGKQLFFDPRLSSNGTVSCNSCHNVMAGGEDNRPVSVGVDGQTGGRSAPTVWNATFQSVQFWDGRAATLEEQATGPIANPIEMGMKDLGMAVERVREIEGYRTAFTQVFGSADAITSDNLAKAIAAYERTLTTPNGALDRHLKGDTTAMTEQQKRGMQTFEQVGCVSCHSGVNLSGPSMAAGTPFLMKFPTFPSAYDEKYDLNGDSGRQQVTGNEADKQMFRVPTLRNIALTAPYFHNGSVATLDEAVRVMGKAQLNLDLSDEQVTDIVAFLDTLTGEFPEQSMPRLPATPRTTFTGK